MKFQHARFATNDLEKSAAHYFNVCSVEIILQRRGSQRWAKPKLYTDNVLRSYRKVHVVVASLDISVKWYTLTYRFFFGPRRQRDWRRLRAEHIARMES